MENLPVFQKRFTQIYMLLSNHFRFKAIFREEEKPESTNQLSSDLWHCS